MSQSVHYQSNRGDGDSNNTSFGEEMHEFITFQSQLSRPTDHYSRQSVTNSEPNANPYSPPPKASATPHTYISKFLRDPIATSLNSFSRVTNLVTSPTFYDDDYISTLHLLRPPGSAERIAKDNHDSEEAVHSRDESAVPLPPPSLPSIPCSQPQYRLPPLTPQEFENDFILLSIDKVLERVFRGGLSSNEFRRQLWPLILGLTDQMTDFDWSELNELYGKYYAQWNSILADQEMRFTAYRERKSLIERDVIRCDRSHQFYKGTTGNLEKLRSLLLTYTMYDFDTGYVQGMSDLASPLIYVMDGDVMKAFWCFVKVMKMIGSNFEMSQSSIKFQLEMLWKLIELTDPCFAQYLANKDSTNCYFAFRWIVCQFKREFMKTENDEYDDCLILWESIWSASIIRKIATNSDDSIPIDSNTIKTDETQENLESNNCNNEKTNSKQVIEIPEVQFSDGSHSRSNSMRNKEKHNSKVNTKKESTIQSLKSGEKRLSDAELYTLSICLSIIRRERDLIMAQVLDATEILKHFNTLQLNHSINEILLHASTIWFWLIESGESLLYKECEQPTNDNNEDYDLLNEVALSDEDYYIINSSNI